MIEQIKMLTLRALVNDEQLMNQLVLKGGSALQLAYNISNRASIDLDFSIADDFTENERLAIKEKLKRLLETEFLKQHLSVFDVEFRDKPKLNKIKWWKGYLLQFKVIDKEKYNPIEIDQTRRIAIKINGQSPKFSVDISSYEYTASKQIKEVDGTVFYVYTPQMIVFEKLRALCQSIPDYSNIIPTASVKGRSRDLYDIWNLCDQFAIDFSSSQSSKILEEIFNAKKVPLQFLNRLIIYKDQQRVDWVNVEDTLTAKSKGFDFYFEFVLNKVERFKIP